MHQAMSWPRKATHWQQTPGVTGRVVTSVHVKPPLLNCAPVAEGQWVIDSDSGIRWNQVQIPDLLFKRQVL